MTKAEVIIAVRHEPMRIAGRLVDTDDRVEVRYPWNDTVVGTVPAGRAEHAREAFAIAAAYQPKLTRYERQKILLATAEALAARKEEISDVITLELGISKVDSLYEVGRAFDVFTLAGQMCIRDDGEIFSCDLTPHGKARKIFTMREPLTAISAITPFNHPLNMVAHKVAPAIATNNCVVVKPTELTPMTALLLADILYEAGLPPEMLSVVTGWPADIGMEMITNPHVDLVTFTGSVPVGKLIAANAHYKRQVLELGGNDPLIILNDLSDDDLARAADLAVAGATKNSGQRCTAVKRILCQESVADRFVPLVLERAKRLRFGDPMDRS
ncbi:aldehyde dehydrogenase family protein, partial [Sinorhizobium meliloti]